MSAGNDVGTGALMWKHVPASGVTILANHCEVEEVSIEGATGVAIWVQAYVGIAACPETSGASGGSSGGAYSWTVRDCILSDCGAGLTTNSESTSGGESAHVQENFLGSGRTNVDEVAYLNISARKWGNGAAAVKDRTLHGNYHRDHYVQFGTGMPFRNDLLSGGGNYSRWDMVTSENGQLNAQGKPVLVRPVFLRPAFVSMCTHGVAPDSTATVLDGVECKNLRTDNRLSTNSAKNVSATYGPNDGMSVFNWQHSDDTSPYGITISDELLFWPAKWWAFGRASVPGFFAQQSFAIPRAPDKGTTWPGGQAIDPETSPFWVTQDRIHVGYPYAGDPPPSIGFGTRKPDDPPNPDDPPPPPPLYYAQGSVIWNSEPAAGNPNGWRCTVSGSPGSWIAMANL